MKIFIDQGLFFLKNILNEFKITVKKHNILLLSALDIYQHPPHLFYLQINDLRLCNKNSVLCCKMCVCIDIFVPQYLSNPRSCHFSSGRKNSELIFFF